MKQELNRALNVFFTLLKVCLVPSLEWASTLQTTALEYQWERPVGAALPGKGAHALTSAHVRYTRKLREILHRSLGSPPPFFQGAEFW